METKRLEESYDKRKVYELEDVRILSSLTAALSSMGQSSGDFTPKLAITKAGATKSVLRALMTLAKSLGNQSGKDCLIIPIVDTNNNSSRSRAGLKVSKRD